MWKKVVRNMGQTKWEDKNCVYYSYEVESKINYGLTLSCPARSTLLSSVVSMHPYDSATPLPTYFSLL